MKITKEWIKTISTFLIVGLVLLLLFYYLFKPTPKTGYINLEFTTVQPLKKKILGETEEYYEVEFNDLIHRIYKDGRLMGPFFYEFGCYKDARLYPEEYEGKSIKEVWFKRAEDRGADNYLWGVK